MSNLLEFTTVLMKKNRSMREEIKQEKIKKETIRTSHFEYSCKKRKISENLIKACLEKGRIVKQKRALHYVLDNLHVVVDLDNETLITTYFKTNYSEAA